MIMHALSSIYVVTCSTYVYSEVGVLLKVQKSGDHHLGCKKPCKYWDKLPTSTGDRRIS